jgi:AP endonuclease-1
MGGSIPNDIAAGTAVLSKQPALKVSYGLPGHPDPEFVKGRIVTLEFANLWLVATYVPNAGMQLKVRLLVSSSFSSIIRIPVQNLAARETWNTHFETYIGQLDASKPVVWTGDLNVAPTAIGEAEIPSTYHDKQG